MEQSNSRAQRLFSDLRFSTTNDPKIYLGTRREGKTRSLILEQSGTALSASEESVSVRKHEKQPGL